MAIDWGAWEYASGNGMRVGIEVTWEAISNTETAATATIKIYTDNQYSFNDEQTLTYSGSISGSTTFTNNDGSTSVLRATKTYTYNYGASEYGSSPGNRTFTAKLSGVFSGITPSNSVTSAIPARPIAAPDPITNASVSRVSDTSQKVTWTNHSSAGKPYDFIYVDRQVNGGAWSLLQKISGSATSYTDTSTTADNEYRYRVIPGNDKGTSGTGTHAYTGYIWTTPQAPSIGTRSGSNGTNQTVTWTNNVGYAEYNTEVWHAQDGVWDSTPVATVGSGVATWTTPSPPDAAKKHKYRVRAKSTSGTTLYSGYSGETSETTGYTAPPNAPTNLAPANNRLIVPTQAATFSWTHNPADGTAQTAYQVQWRVQGNATWTERTKTTSSTSSWSAPANTFPTDSTIEWQVRTWGAATTAGSDGTGASPYSATATFKTTGDPNNARQTQRVTAIDLDTGDTVALGVGAMAPVGAMMQFAGASAPPGWLLCDGAQYAQTAYPDLFAVVGTTFNTGGETSGYFRVPDLKDRVPVGVSSTKARGSRGGATNNEVTLGTANLPKHTHTFSATTSQNGAHVHPLDLTSPWDSANYGNYARRGSQGSYVTITANTSVGSAGDHTHTVSGTTSDGGFANSAFSVQNLYLALHHIIKV